MRLPSAPPLAVSPTRSLPTLSLPLLPQGFYVAKAQGLYEKAGLDVTFISPHSDEYKVTPASRVESGEALLAIAPSESVISYATWPEAHKQRPKLRAVAAVLQADTSAIATLKSSGIDRPAKVRGRGLLRLLRLQVCGCCGCRRVAGAWTADGHSCQPIAPPPLLLVRSSTASGTPRTPRVSRDALCSR